MVWYESARLPHGRPSRCSQPTIYLLLIIIVRFQGQFYDNVFVHFKPADRRWYGVEVMGIR